MQHGVQGFQKRGEVRDGLGHDGLRYRQTRPQVKYAPDRQPRSSQRSYLPELEIPAPKGRQHKAWGVSPRFARPTLRKPRRGGSRPPYELGGNDVIHEVGETGAPRSAVALSGLWKG